jgi:hypothetical protein
MNSSSLELQLFEPDPRVLYSIDLAAELLAMSRRTIVLCCKYGLVTAASDPLMSGWYFNEDALRMLRRIEALRILCGGNLSAARMILALQDEVSRLQAELRFWRG